MPSCREKVAPLVAWRTSLDVGKLLFADIYKEVRDKRQEVTWNKLFFRNVARPIYTKVWFGERWEV